MYLGYLSTHEAVRIPVESDTPDLVATAANLYAFSCKRGAMSQTPHSNGRQKRVRHLMPALPRRGIDLCIPLRQILVALAAVGDSLQQHMRLLRASKVCERAEKTFSG